MSKKYPFYAGLDQHHKMTRVIVIDPEEQIKTDATVHHVSKEQVAKELQRLIPTGSLVCVEATGFWYWMNDLLEDAGYETILVHSKEVAEIAQTKKKNDRKDAFILAKLGKDGRLHRAYKMPREVRPLRDLLRHRAELMALRTCCKNQIHAVLHKHGIWHPFSDLFGSRGKSFLSSLPVHEAFQHIVQDQWVLVEEFTARVAATTRLIEKQIPEDDITRLLKTIPGIGSLLARILRYEIWDIDRFLEYSELQSYVGMAPATWQSADTLHQGRISREGNVYVRWAMVEAAQHVGKQDRYLDWKFHQLRKRKGKNKARVAVACDLLQAVFFVWKRREPYKAKPAPNVPLRVIREKTKLGVNRVLASSSEGLV